MSRMPLPRTIIGMAWAAILCSPSISPCQDLPAPTAISRVEKPTYTPHMTFDVASIREYRSDGGVRYIDSPTHNSRYRAVGAALWGMILFAYDIKIVDQLENLPHWAHDTLYTIDAKSDSSTDEALAKLSDSDALAEKRHMLQVLLAERFHLQIYPEKRTSNTYELITTARTAKLMTPVQGDRAKTVSTCTMYFHRNKGAEVDSKGCPFHIFFSDLQQNLGTNVLDRTGMTGVYAYHLMWWPAQLPQGDTAEDRYPPLKDAVREQLGLELKPTQGPMTFWVVDHVERPTPN